MPGRTVKRLTDLEIDEISLVDRPANQHGLVAIAKRAEDGPMPIFDADGYQVEESDLQHGDVVYDEEGTELMFVDNDEPGPEDFSDEDDSYGYDAEDAYDGERQLAGVGKAFAVNAGGDASRLGSALVRSGGKRKKGLFGAEREQFSAGRKGYSNSRASTPNRAGFRSRQAQNFLGDNRRGIAVGAGTAAATGSAGYARGRRHNTAKSLGESVYEELSKALGDNDRDEVIAKMGDLVQEARDEAAAAWEFAKGLAEQRELEDYSRLAETYSLPVAPERLGAVLKRAADRLPQGDLQLLDQVFSAAGVGFDELGYNGTSESDVMGQVYAMANEAVGKSDLTSEQAIAAMFEANPAAYDQYLAESR